MNLVNTLQTQSKDDATKALFDTMNSKAMLELTSMKLEAYSRPFSGVGGRRDREDDEGYSRTKVADDAHNKKIDQKSKTLADMAREAIAKKNAAKNVSEDSIDEGVRKVAEYSAGRHKATTHRDTDWGEYRVKFHTDGKHLPDADYHTDDKTDATETAKSQIDKLHAKD